MSRTAAVAPFMHDSNSLSPGEELKTEMAITFHLTINAQSGIKSHDRAGLAC